MSLTSSANVKSVKVSVGMQRVYNEIVNPETKEIVYVDLTELVTSNDIARFTTLSKRMENGEIVIVSYLSTVNCHFLVNVLTQDIDSYVWNVICSQNGELIALGKVGVALNEEDKQYLNITINSGYLTPEKLPTPTGSTDIGLLATYGDKYIEYSLDEFRTYISAMIASKVGELKFIELVEKLPTTGESNKLYLALKNDTEENNIFDEWVWVGTTWEKIGETKVSGNIDLSNYVQKTDYASTLKAGVIKAGGHTYYGFTVSPNGIPYVDAYSLEEYNNMVYPASFISKQTLENVKGDLVKRAVTEGLITLTDEEKAKWTDMIGALPLSGGEKLRVVLAGNEKYLATEEYVDEKIGEIETALDELHTYAQNLVNGGSVE